MALSKITADSLGANAVTANSLSNTAITTALGFTPANNTSAGITTALGYTPANKAGDTITGATTFSNTVSVTGAATFSSNVTVSTNTLFVDTTNNRIGINTLSTTSGCPLNVYGGDIRVENASSSVRTRYVAGSNQWNLEASQSSNQFGIYDAVAGIGRMFIDSGGRVTKPYQPAFRVSYFVAPPAAWSSGGRVLSFTDVGINIGSHYDTGTNRFTAPIAGRYLFMVNKAMNTQGAGKSIRHPSMSFYVNGGANYSQNVAITSGTDLGAGDYQHFTICMTAILNLAQNDYVQVYLNYNNSPATLYEYAESYFQGYLLG